MQLEVLHRKYTQNVSNYSSWVYSYLTDLKAKHFLEVCWLADEQQVEGPASAEVGHDNCIDRHWGEEFPPGRLEFLRVEISYSDEILIKHRPISASQNNIDICVRNLLKPCILHSLLKTVYKRPLLKSSQYLFVSQPPALWEKVTLRKSRAVNGNNTNIYSLTLPFLLENQQNFKAH